MVCINKVPGSASHINEKIMRQRRGLARRDLKLENFIAIATCSQVIACTQNHAPRHPCKISSLARATTRSHTKRIGCTRKQCSVKIVGTARGSHGFRSAKIRVSGKGTHGSRIAGTRVFERGTHGSRIAGTRVSERGTHESRIAGTRVFERASKTRGIDDDTISVSTVTLVPDTEDTKVKVTGQFQRVSERLRAVKSDKTHDLCI